MENVFERIRKRYNELTKGQKVVAKFILDEPKHVALHPAKTIGKLTGTSETTVIRLCYALGYKGYSMVQDEIRKSLLNQKENPLKEYRDRSGEIDEENLIARVMEQDVSSIQLTLGKLNHELIRKSVKSILKAQKIIVVGFRSSHPPANWLTYALNIIRGNTHLYRGEIDDSSYLLTEMNMEWLVIAFSFPRYMRETISFVEAAKEKGARVLAITDDELSPIGPVADLLIKVCAPSPVTLNGMATLFSLLHVLVTGVVSADRERVRQRIQMYDETSSRYYPFVSQDKL